MKLFGSIVLCLLVIICCKEEQQDKVNEETYVEFPLTPEVFLDMPGGDYPMFDNEKMHKAMKKQKANIAAILVYYGVPVKVSVDGRITIPKSVLEDSNFVNKISSRARDTAWYKLNLLPGY